MTLNFFKRTVPVLALVLVMGTMGAAGCHRQEQSSPGASLETAENTPMAALDGFVWQSSAPQSKLDFLLGVECAMAMEAAIKQVAEERGKKKMSPQAVGQAVGRNPISIIIPCHRCIGAGNRLTGYAWGLEKKAWLLRHEGWGQGG